MSVQESRLQAEKLSAAFQRRADVLKALEEVDTEIDALQTGMATTAVSTTPAKTKRGPGRPKKEKTEETKAKRGPGRPKKEKTEETKAKRGPGRPKKTEKPEAEAETPRKRHRNKVSMKDVITEVIGGSPKRGVDLDGIVTGCQKKGYKSTSDAKGYVQNVRTNLNWLMNHEVVVKTEDKRYFLKEHFEALDKEEENAEAA